MCIWQGHEPLLGITRAARHPRPFWHCAGASGDVRTFPAIMAPSCHHQRSRTPGHDRVAPPIGDCHHRRPSRSHPSCQPAPTQLISAQRRRSTAVVQRFCKPKVGSSILSAGTKQAGHDPRDLVRRLSPGVDQSGTRILRTGSRPVSSTIRIRHRKALAMMRGLVKNVHSSSKGNESPLTGTFVLHGDGFSAFGQAKVDRL